MNRDELIKYTEANADIGNECDVLKTDCDIIVYLFDNCEITVPNENRYFVDVNCIGVKNMVRKDRVQKYKQEKIDSGLILGETALAHTGAYDFGHTNAGWESVIELGIWGLRKRIDKYAEKTSDMKKLRFYQNIARVYDAALRFIKRAAEEAKVAGRCEMAAGLEHLRENSPSNLYEALQTSIVYYTLQQFFEGTPLRTLGRVDKLFYPYYKIEDKAIAHQMLYDYIMEVDRFKADANIPFAIGGTDIDGNSIVNELSYVMMDIYRNAGTADTKVHMFCSEDMPDDLLMQVFAGVRDGSNSIVFMNDGKVIESLEKLGEDHISASNYHVVGCYECGGDGELTCSCNARVSLPKALELALNKGRDMLTGELIGLENDGVFESFEDVYAEFARQISHIAKCAMKATDIYEAHYDMIHAAPILSGTYTSALEKGGDVYCDNAAKYNNSSVNAVGLATAVDSLAAIRKLVFEDGTMTMDRLIDVLKSNWDGEEKLRLFIKHRFPKYGMGDKYVDDLAARVVDTLADEISGKPNKKGGVYRLGLFSIDWKWEFGKKTAASADGRLCGETISQNSGATFGADKEGATAHLTSVSRLDTSNTPNGTIVDIDMHSSAVKGESGVRMMVSTLRTYFKLGGFAVHYNVLDTETLKKAKLDPDAYPNLQVRVCGWNALFNTLTDHEKDEFIARSIR